MYDPRHSLWHGWGVLFRQWREAGLIARENRAAGVQPMSPAAVWKLWRDSRRAQ
jgi:hypothetical protein